MSRFDIRKDFYNWDRTSIQRLIFDRYHSDILSPPDRLTYSTAHALLASAALFPIAKACRLTYAARPASVFAVARLLASCVGWSALALLTFSETDAMEKKYMSQLSDKQLWALDRDGTVKSAYVKSRVNWERQVLKKEGPATLHQARQCFRAQDAVQRQIKGLVTDQSLVETAPECSRWGRE